MAQWPKEVEETLKNLPDHPGVYLMRDAQDTIIYVGRAQRSSFQSFCSGTSRRVGKPNSEEICFAIRSQP